jgi:hypothetical protein
VVTTTNGGGTWTIEHVPGEISLLRDISCPTASQCWAVGSSSTSGVILTLNGAGPGAATARRMVGHRRGRG